MPRITDLPSTGSIQPSDLIAVVDESGESPVLKKATIDTIGTYIGDNYGGGVTGATITETVSLDTGPSLYFVQDNYEYGYAATLPPPSSMTNRQLVFITMGYSENGFSILPNGAETIQGGSSYAMNGPGASVTLWCDGSNWYITASASNF